MQILPSRIDPISWIETLAVHAPHRAWLETDDGRVITYQMLGLAVKQRAAQLVRAGIMPGDRVAAQLEKSPEAVILYFSCLAIGAIYMPLNTGYTDAEIAYFVHDAEPAMFVGEGDRPTPGQTHTLADLDSVRAGAAADHVPFAPDMVAAMLYTSGTTGRPKGAMLTRANLASNAAALAKAWAITADDVLIHALPIFHVHGLFIAINSITAAGGTMLFRSRFDPADVIAQMPRATLLMGVPTFYTRLLDRPELRREATKAMRLFISGSAPLLPDTHRAFKARTGHAILERYGMTETGINSSNPYRGVRIAGTVGPPLSGVDVRVTDPDQGSPLPAETIGMIEVRGPNIFAGYWRNPEKTAAEFREGRWFITGDLGKIDAAGYVHIIGRGKDLIITGGYNVYPKEVETEIDALVGVEESAVIGVPHADFGEAVVAVVVAQTGAVLDPAAMLATLRTCLAAYKLPKAIHIVDALPRNTMGKVQKTALREVYAR